MLEDGDDPEEEEIELSEAYGWEYVTRRGDFYIYRSLEENVRELNTDPEVYALAMKMVQKRQRASAFHCVIWAFVIPFIKITGFNGSIALVASMLYLKTGFFLFLLFFFGVTCLLFHFPFQQALIVLLDTIPLMKSFHPNVSSTTSESD